MVAQKQPNWMTGHSLCQKWLNLQAFKYNCNAIIMKVEYRAQRK